MSEEGNRRLVATDLSFRIGHSDIVSRFNLTLAAGAVVGLIGPNGAGKTTTVDLLSGFLRPFSGAIMLDGKDITHAAPYSRTLLGLTRTFQESPAIEGLTVREHLQLAHDCVRSRRRAGLLTADALLPRFGLSRVSETLGTQLPTGPRRLLDLARAVATAPTVLLLDEPFSGLAADETQIVLREIAALKQGGAVIVIIEHRLHLLGDVADYVLALIQGATVASGCLDTVLAHPEVQRAYLGRSFAGGQPT